MGLIHYYNEGKALRRKFNTAVDPDGIHEYQARLQERRERIRTCLSVFGALAVILALLSIIFQVSGLREQERRARYQAVAERGLDLDRLFVDHPLLFKYFQVAPGEFDKGISPPPADEPAARALAVNVIDYFVYLFNQMKGLGIVPDGRLVLLGESGNADWISWSEYIKDQFMVSPVMCDALKRYKSEYPQDFVDAVRALKPPRVNRPPGGICPELDK